MDMGKRTQSLSIGSEKGGEKEKIEKDFPNWLGRPGSIAGVLYNNPSPGNFCIL